MQEGLVSALRQASISPVTAVLRVDVPGNVGYLFFLKGEVVHASTLELEGEPAFTDILGWTDASLAWCERRWPSQRTIQRSWTELQTLIEADALTTGNRDAAPASAQAPETAESPPVQLHLPTALGLERALANTEFKNALRLSNAGHVKDSRGSSAHLKSILRSSLTLGASFGECLGLGPLIAAEASWPVLHRVIGCSTEDAIVAESPGGDGLQLARAFLKL
jgi:hypothetical protein